MKKAVVLGASGGMGCAIVNELVSRRIETVAFARTKEKLNRLFRGVELVSVYSGDVYQADDLRKACAGADVIFHSVGIPYPDWEERHPVLMDLILKVARETGAKVALVDNIYAYGRSKGQKVSEDMKKQPHTKKGKIRMQLEETVKSAHGQGTPTFIAHFPDFYGPNAESTLLHHTFQAVVQNKSAMFIGKQSIPREYIFTPDGAKAIVELALREEAYGQCWNIPGAGVITGEEIISIVRKITGYQKRVGTIGRTMMALAGLFNPMMREVVEMMYLTEEPVVLSGEKYEALIGPLPKTPYEGGIKKTIEHLKAV